MVRTVRAALWSAASNGSQIVLNLLGVVLLARWIGPEAYGLFGSAAVVIGLLHMLSGAALTASITQREHIEPGHVDATFWLLLGLAVPLAAGAWLMAPELTTWLGAPDAADVLRVLCWCVPMGALSAVPMALLARDLRFGELARISMSSAVAANLVGITAAGCGAGLWSLVAMEFTREVFALIGGFALSGWRPGVRGRWSHLRDLSRFNLQVLLTHVLGHVDQLLPRALIGALMGPQALGWFLMANRVFDEVSRLATGPLAGIAMAATARARGDVSTLQRIVLGLYRMSTLFALPAFVGLAAIAPVLLPWLFGEHWTPAVIALQILLLAGLRTATGVFNVSILRAMGRADLPIVLLGAGVVLNAVLLPALAGWGLAGAALAVLARTLATWPLGCLFIRATTGIPVAEQIRAGGAATLAALVMGPVVMFALAGLLPGLPASMQLLLAIPLGGLVYAGVLMLLSPRTLPRTLDVLRAGFDRSDRSLAAVLGEPGASRPA